jgi:chromosome segregation ATPase
MSNPGGLSGGFIGGGGGSGGGTSFAGVGNGGQLIDRRIDHVSQAINTLSRRITDLEVARDENSERYQAMESFKDAGEPVNQHYVDCLKQNVRLIEENDVLRYQYEAMKNETVRCKELLAKKNQEIDILNHRIEFFQKMAHDFELENKDAKWYKEQAIKKCIDIVERIKNDPLTDGDGKRWMVAICEDIQRAIEKEFRVK